MGEVVSLRRARKAKARVADAAQAAANRVAHGLTKAQKAADARAQVQRDALLDGAKLTDS